MTIEKVEKVFGIFPRSSTRESLPRGYISESTDPTLKFKHEGRKRWGTGFVQGPEQLTLLIFYRSGFATLTGDEINKARIHEKISFLRTNVYTWKETK